MVSITYNYKEGKDEMSIESNLKVKDLLKKLDINIEEVIVKREDDGKILLDEDEVKNNDKIKIFKIVSGG